MGSVGLLLGSDASGELFWEYVSPHWAGKFLDEWTSRAMRSRLEPMKKVARTLRNHRELILNWFRAQGEISSGAVEGLNNKVKLVTRKSYGIAPFPFFKMNSVLVNVHSKSASSGFLSGVK